MKYIFNILIFLCCLQTCIGIADEYGCWNVGTVSFAAHGFDKGVACPSTVCNSNYSYSAEPSTQRSLHSGFRINSGSYTTSHYDYSPQKMSVAELEEYFCGHSEAEIFCKKNLSLLLSDAFITYIKQFPEYTGYIEHFHDKFHHSSAFKRLVRKDLGKRLCHLHEELQCVQKAEEAKTRVRAQEKSKLQKLSREHKYLYASWQDAHTEHVSIDHAVRIINRMQSYEQIDELQLYTKDYRIASETKTLLATYGIDTAHITHLHGSAIEHMLHQEFVCIAHQANTLSNFVCAGTEDCLFDSLMHAIDVGTTATQELQPTIASQSADFCWAVLDLLQAAGEGVVLAGYNTAQFVYHIATQPVETVRAVIDGILYVADTLFIINDLPDQLRECDIPNKEYYYQKIAQTEQQLEDLGKTFAENIKNMQLRDWVKHGTAFIVEGILLHKVTQFTINACSHLAPLCGKLLQSIEYEEAVAACIDGEMISIGRIMPEIENATTLIQQAEESIVKSGTVVVELFAAETETLLNLLEQLANFDLNKIHHILQEHHLWGSICAEPRNWEVVKDILKKVIQNGYEGLRDGKHPCRILKIGNKNVEVVYCRTPYGLKLTNAWVQK